MPAVIVNLASFPPLPATPGLATGGGGSQATSQPGNPPTTGTGTTPTPVNVPTTGPPIVTEFPSLPNPGDQVILDGVLYQWVGSGQFAGITGFWEPVVSTPPGLQGTHLVRLASYPAASYAEGTLFYETDRQVVYKVQGIVWIYWSGAMAGALAGLPTDLGTNDTGFTYQATDYRHLYRWTGAGWEFDPNDAGSGWLVQAGPGFFISSGLFGLSDGSSYLVSQSDGTTSNVTTAVLANTYLRR